MTLFVDIDILGSRFLGKSRHSHDFPCNRYDKTCSGGNFYLADGNDKIFRPTYLGLSDSDFCVLAIQTGSLSNPRAMIFFKSLLACAV